MMMRVTIMIRKFLKECDMALTLAIKKKKESKDIAGLNDVLLIAVPGAVTLTATDRNILVIHCCQSVKVQQMGLCYLPAKLLRETLVEIAKFQKEVVMEVNGPHAHITYSDRFGNGNTWLRTNTNGERLLCNVSTIPQAIVSSAKIKEIYKSAGTDDAREELNTVFMNLREGQLVAADGHRMQIVDAGTSADMTALVPIGTIQTILHFDGDVETGMCGKNVFFRNATTTVVSICERKNYADCTQLLSEFPQSTNVITMNRVDLLKALRLVAAVNKDSINCYLRFDGLALYAMAQEVSELLTIIPCNYTGDIPAGFAVRPKFLYQCIEKLNSRSVTIRFGAPLKPLFLCDGKDAMHAIVMPQRGGDSIGYKPAFEDAVYYEFPKDVLQKMREVKMQKRILRKLEIARTRNVAVAA